MEKRAIIAVVLSGIILMAWYYINMPVRQENAVSVKNEIKLDKTDDIVSVSREGISSTNLSEEKTQEILVNTKTSEILLSTKGASIISWKLKEKQKGGWKPIDLVLNKNPQLVTFESIVYDVDKDKLTLTEDKPEGEIKFKGISEQGLLVSKTYRFFYDGYVFNLEIRLENRGQKPIQSEVSLNWGPGIGIDSDIQPDMRAVLYKDGRLTKKVKPGEYQGEIEWAGMDNRYFLIALLPQNTEFPLFSMEKRDDMPFIRLSEKTLLEVGGAKIFNIDVYGGLKRYSTLRAMGRRLGETCDLGMFSGLSRIMLAILGFFYKLTNNYGWAIILLTIVIQIPLFPLTAKSFKSMRAMQKLQPQMIELRKKYKDDPRRLNVEIMNLYKNNKVNPFGGCLPMLLQLPIFWALFTALRNAVELRHAPFILWIKDLSIPDGSGVNAVFRFGTTLPFIGDSLNILVILMGGLMFVQQKISSSDPSQAKMVVFMPILFTVLFWNFPSGLVLYWVANSVITIIEQYIMVKKQ